MSATHEDLDEFLEKFKNFFRQHRLKKIENDLLHLTERLYKELEASESNANHWESCCKALLSRDCTNLTTKYVALTEKYELLVLEHNNLKIEFDEKGKQYKEQLEIQKNCLTLKLTESEETYKSEILNLKNRIESDKICYETKEKQLQNELHALQATTAFQIDEIEANLKSQIVDLNNKLKQSQSTARLLTAEIGKLKIQLANQTPTSDKLYFQETPIQTVRNNLWNRQTARNLNSFCTESEENFNSFDFQSPSSHLAEGTISKTQKENNIENINKKTNILNIQPSTSLYSATPSVDGSTHSEQNLFASALNNLDQTHKKQDKGSACSYGQNKYSKIFQEKSTATPEKFQQLSSEVKIFEPKKSSLFGSHTATPLYKGSGAKKNYILPAKMPGKDNEAVKDKPRKRKLFNPEQSYEEADT